MAILKKARNCRRSARDHSQFFIATDHERVQPGRRQHLVLGDAPQYGQPADERARQLGQDVGLVLLALARGVQRRPSRAEDLPSISNPSRQAGGRTQKATKALTPTDSEMMIWTTVSLGSPTMRFL
jgi:hypothetical protein